MRRSVTRVAHEERERSVVANRVLSAAFAAQVLTPLLDRAGAADASVGLLGWGSDVLGYEDARSTDHDWAPRATVLVRDAAVAPVREAVETGLPERFRGWPVRVPVHDGPVGSLVEVVTLPSWCRDRLGFDATRCAGTLDWLATPQQALLGVTSGAVFSDPTGALRRLREALSWYPDSLWRWMLACQWTRIAQEQPFVGRTAEVGDAVGCAVLVARLARDAMRLALLQARAYAPYSKWLGSAFTRLPDPEGLGALLTEAVREPFPTSADRLNEALAVLADRQAALGLTAPVDASVRRFHSRPWSVVGAEAIAAALLPTVGDELLRRLPLTGAVDQVTDNTDLVTSRAALSRLRALWAVD